MIAVFDLCKAIAALQKYVYSQGYFLVCSKIQFTGIQNLRLLDNTEAEPFGRKKTKLYPLTFLLPQA